MEYGYMLLFISWAVRRWFFVGAHILFLHSFGRPLVRRFYNCSCSPAAFCYSAFCECDFARLEFALCLEVDDFLHEKLKVQIAIADLILNLNQRYT